MMRPQLSRSALSVMGATLLALSSSTALAQSIPSSVEPGRVRTDIEKQIQPTVGVPQTEITSSPLVKAPQGAEKVKFTLKQVNVDGAHDISADDLKDIYSNDLNKTVTLQRIYEIANQITLLYRDHGYILSRAVVPPQEIGKGGVVRIQIVEGFVTHYQVKGDVPAHLKNKVEDYASRLMGKGTVSAKNLERYLLLMNDLPGVRVRSILSPSADTAGGADLTLVVEQKKTDFLLGMDNFGNSYLGPVRYTGGVQWNSPWGDADQINANVLLVPDHNEVQYYALGYQRFVGHEGTRVGLNASYTQTEPSLPDALGGSLDPEGVSTSYSASVVHPFIRSRSFNVNGGLSFEYNENVTEYATGLDAIETDDDLRVIRATSDMSYLDGWKGFNVGRLQISQGLEILGSSEAGDSNLSRAQGEADFTKFNLELSRLQRVYGPLNAFLGVSGQWSDDPLLVSEEMGLGGPDYGRGYDLSEVTGDRGLAGKAEISYRQTPGYKYLDTYEPYVFYDLGAVWNYDPGAGLAGKASLASTGVGLRANINSNLRADTFLAKPLTRDVPSRGDESDEWRWKFSITSNF
ncbi:MAG TPA: ShlB/FhaC/HecB family hemolysin secretion/activation protein [Alphaproteobacteria bacterium]